MYNVGSIEKRAYVCERDRASRLLYWLAKCGFVNISNAKFAARRASAGLGYCSLSVFHVMGLMYNV